MGNKPQRLLVVTQVVDKNDSNLGFFHRWIEEFAKHCESVIVICLKEGLHQLPKNVAVYSLGKPSFAPDSAKATTGKKASEGEGRRFLSRIRYALRFRKLIREHSGKYNAVFVHMNPEYVLLGGFFWRAQGKKIALWYVHKSVTWTLRIALRLADIIFTASPESFRIASLKVHVMGHGIDTEFFSPDASVRRGKHFLSVGRLMQSKQHNLAIRAAYDASVPLRIAGEGPERERLAALVRELGADVTFLGGLTQEKLRDEYRAAAKLVHRSETGSLDKVVLEAAACGCSIDSTDPAIRVLPLSGEYVREHHSLQSLIPRIFVEFSLQQ